MRRGLPVLWGEAPCFRQASSLVPAWRQTCTTFEIFVVSLPLHPDLQKDSATFTDFLHVIMPGNPPSRDQISREATELQSCPGQLLMPAPDDCCNASQ